MERPRPLPVGLHGQIGPGVEECEIEPADSLYPREGVWAEKGSDHRSHIEKEFRAYFARSPFRGEFIQIHGKGQFKQVEF